MNKQLFIVNPNRIDFLTLCGFIFVAVANILCFNKKFAFAIAALFVAMLIDGLDGYLARKLNLASRFGRYLDGFVDMHSYVITPPLLLYLWGYNAWHQMILLMVMMICGTLRLAAFNEIGNIEKGPTLSYLGMPVFWITLMLATLYVLNWVVPKSAVFLILSIFLPIISGLMILNRPFYKFKSAQTIISVTLSGAVVFFVAGLIGL